MYTNVFKCVFVDRKGFTKTEYQAFPTSFPPEELKLCVPPSLKEAMKKRLHDGDGSVEMVAFEEIVFELRKVDNLHRVAKYQEV